MHFARSLVVLVLAVAVLATPVKRDAAKVESDIEYLITLTVSLGISVIAFPDNGGTFVQALDIHQSAVNLADLVQVATEDAKVKQTSADFVARKDALSRIGVLKIPHYDLKTLLMECLGLEGALREIVPNDSVTEYLAEFKKINEALTEATDTYSS